jgi:hypothetical protein
MARHFRWWRALGAAALVGGFGACKTLEVQNPNAPERERAFSDPATIVASAGGTIKTWVNTRFSSLGPSGNAGPPMTLSAMADSYTASWNNWQMRYYSSYGVECADRCGWVNSTSTALGQTVEPFWYGAYSMLSSANDALFAIRLSANPPDLGTDQARTEVIAQMAQAMAHAWVALNYDKGFIIQEDTDILALELSPRQAIRDKAIELFDKAYQLAKASTFTTDGTWFGAIQGPTYSNLQIAKAIRTMQAELLAHYPRNAEENAQVNWGQVATYASQGISSGTDGAPFDFTAYQDDVYYTAPAFASMYHYWGNDITTTRVDTRVARLLSTTQVTPWPGGAGNPRPADAAGNPIGGVFGVDLRMGNGCFGDVDDYFDMGGCKGVGDPKAGTDFVWSPVAIFPAARGSFHQSNIGHIRFRCLAEAHFDCPTGQAPIPLYLKSFNDLLWAEGLIRTNTNLGRAAELINNTRVGRGGLSQLTAANTTNELLAALLYEQDIEQIATAETPFYNRRRYTSRAGQAQGPYVWNTLWPGTPREMPIPAKDLALLRMEVYTWGGPGGAPNSSVAPHDPEAGVGRVKNVREIYADWERSWRHMPSPRRSRN